ncbi:MAG: hypothetical protein HY078_13385 [Elusimicrobia bacterium]|nr:hypothetical protein [Elusimicrobiota bacterium]
MTRLAALLVALSAGQAAAFEGSTVPDALRLDRVAQAAQTQPVPTRTAPVPSAQLPREIMTCASPNGTPVCKHIRDVTAANSAGCSYFCVGKFQKETAAWNALYRLYQALPASALANAEIGALARAQADATCTGARTSVSSGEAAAALQTLVEARNRGLQALKELQIRAGLRDLRSCTFGSRR